MTLSRTWRKSKRSGGQGACVEVRSLTLAPEWRKSTRSNVNGSCVEARSASSLVQVRDTKDKGTGPILSFAPAGWGNFVSALKSDPDGWGYGRRAI